MLQEVGRMRQLVCTMFISSNRASFQLWRKKNLVKHQKVSKNCENDCRLTESHILKYLSMSEQSQDEFSQGSVNERFKEKELV